MAVDGSEVFLSLVRRAQDKLHERQDILADLNDIRYWYRCGEFQDSVNLILSAKELLNLLIEGPTLELLPFALKSHVIAFEAVQHKKHLAPPLPRESSADHTAECLEVRGCINDLCDKLRNVPRFTESLRLPFAELTGCVARTLCHQAKNWLSEVKEILKDFAKAYANPGSTSDEHKRLLLGLRGCMYALDIDKALQASSPSSPPPLPSPPPPLPPLPPLLQPPRFFKRQIETSDQVRAESSAEPRSKRRRPEQSVHTSSSEDPLDDLYPRHCDHDGPCSSTKLECRCKICHQECGCSAICEKKLPSCDCEGPCREDCGCVRNNAECIDSRCSCSECPNNFQEQKPVKLVDLASGGVASSQNLTTGTFLGVLARDHRTGDRQDVHSGDLYQIAKNASVDVCKEDSLLHRIEASSSQSEQNVVVLAYHCKEGPGFIIRTTKDVQAREQLLMPLDLGRGEHAREENDGVARDTGSVEDHETYPGESGIDDDLESSEDPGEESEYQTSDASDSVSDEITKEDECLSESDGEKDSVFVADDQHKQPKKRTRSRATAKKSAELHAHYALVERECLTLTGLLKLSKLKRKQLRHWLKSAPCCTIRDDTKPGHAIHDQSKCTISTADITETFKTQVAKFEDGSRKSIVSWTSELEQTLLRLRARGTTMPELEKHLNTKHTNLHFTQASLWQKWAKLKKRKTNKRKPCDPKMIAMIEAATHPLDSHDLVKKACDYVRDKSEANLKSWIEGYRDGIRCEINFQSLETCFVSKDNTINHKARACSKGSQNPR